MLEFHPSSSGDMMRYCMNYRNFGYWEITGRDSDAYGLAPGRCKLSLWPVAKSTYNTMTMLLHVSIILKVELVVNQPRL